MQIKELIKHLEKIAPPMLQESYDNAGLIAGNASWDCTGAIITLDATEDVILEAVARNCNLVIAHHPIVFTGLKKITGTSYVEKTVIAAIKHDVAIYAIHTNLDNVMDGVNGKIADMLGLVNREVLQPKTGMLQKLAVFVPTAQKEQLRNALFAAGAGNIGRYSECSFSIAGEGSFKAGPGTNPFVGNLGEQHLETEHRLEVIFPVWRQPQVLTAMRQNHPYEEVAHDIFNLENAYQQTGSGLVGILQTPLTEEEMLIKLQHIFNIPVIKHTGLLGKPVNKIAICGGAGSFLTKAAIRSGADMYITSDIKYHEFFDAEGKLLLADIGHYESEHHTITLLFDILTENFPNFAVLKTGVQTNPVRYFSRSSNKA